MDKKILIEAIIPLYNFYKDNKDKISSTEALEVMWDIGNHIKNFLKNHKIKPHALYREIYGKAEGSENIIQKSYITREFQGRCFRIRNIFTNKEQIKKDLPYLNSFTAFRETMPFFDNKKYILIGEEKEKLLKMLNSNVKSKLLLKKIKELQAQKINKKNPRTQKLHEVACIKENFIAFYNYIYNLITIKNYTLAVNKASISSESLRNVAKITASLCQEGLKIDKIMFSAEKLDKVWVDYYNDINNLINQKDAKQRRRFRRLVPPERIIRLADMLYALTDRNAYENFK